MIDDDGSDDDVLLQYVSISESIFMISIVSYSDRADLFEARMLWGPHQLEHQRLTSSDHNSIIFHSLKSYSTIVWPGDDSDVCIVVMIAMISMSEWCFELQSYGLMMSDTM